MKARKTVSPAVVEKNRRNAQQSTGPKTPQGKRNSSFNALKHGLTAQVLRFTSDGEPIDKGLAEVFVGLQERYDSNDILGKLLIDCAVADYWRLSKGLELEMMHFVRNGDSSFHPKGETQNILRYNTANRRAFLKNLELLEKMQGLVDKPADEAPADEAPADEATKDEAPVDEAPVDEPPVHEATVDELEDTQLVTEDAAAANPDSHQASAPASQECFTTVTAEDSTNSSTAESALLDALE